MDYEQCENCEECAGKLIDLNGVFVDYLCSGSFGLLYASENLPDCKYYKPRENDEAER